MSLMLYRWIPRALRKKAKHGEGDEAGEEVESVKKKWILRGVECECQSGQVLAM